MIGCGLPAAHFLKSRSKGVKVGIGMISRGEVGLIIAGVAISAQVISESVYSAIVGMVILTTILTPILLKVAYDRDARKEAKPLESVFNKGKLSEPLDESSEH